MAMKKTSYMRILDFVAGSESDYNRAETRGKLKEIDEESKSLKFALMEDEFL
ncbi:MAG: hypothetical protein HQM13_24150 [SAR324 cluster bacterium]|nr:hypothetical protein [SAR324 cluster bacterium]